MRSLVNRIKHELPLKLISLLMAIALWGYVLAHENPTMVSRRVFPVQVVNVGPGLCHTGSVPSEIQLVLRGRRSVLNSKAIENIQLKADMTGQAMGTIEVAVSVQNLPRGVEVMGTPGLVRVTLDKVLSADRPVVLNVVGTVAEGYVADTSNPSPETVKVTGPGAVLGRVAKVVAEIDISGLNTPREFYPAVQARDERDMPVSGVELEPKSVKVVVKVSHSPVRALAVWPSLTSPPEGYTLRSVDVSPLTVVVTGQARRLERLAYAATEQIDISDLRGTRQFTVSLDLPEGVRAIDVSSVTVTATVVKRQPPASGVEEGPETEVPQPSAGGGIEQPGPQPEQPDEAPSTSITPEGEPLGTEEGGNATGD